MLQQEAKLQKYSLQAITIYVMIIIMYGSEWTYFHLSQWQK